MRCRCSVPLADPVRAAQRRATAGRRAAGTAPDVAASGSCRSHWAGPPRRQLRAPAESARARGLNHCGLTGSGRLAELRMRRHVDGGRLRPGRRCKRLLRMGCPSCHERLRHQSGLLRMMGEGAATAEAAMRAGLGHGRAERSVTCRICCGGTSKTVETAAADAAALVSDALTAARPAKPSSVVPACPLRLS